MYAVIDVETGGFSKEKNGLCEVAMIILSEDKKILDRASYLIQPYLRPDSTDMVSYKDDAMAVNGITMDELLSGDTATHVAQKIEEALNSYGVATIIAHNAKSMDQAWLEFFLSRFGSGFKFKHTICTLDLARKSNLSLLNNKLSTLLEHFGINNDNEHRALSDAHATYLLWKKLIN